MNSDMGWVTWTCVILNSHLLHLPSGFIQSGLFPVLPLLAGYYYYFLELFEPKWTKNPCHSPEMCPHN